MIHEELSGKIIGAAMDVLYTLKPGLDEKLYENALVIELTSRGHKVEQQRQFPILLVNFKNAKLDWKRIVRSTTLNTTTSSSSASSA